MRKSKCFLTMLIATLLCSITCLETISVSAAQKEQEEFGNFFTSDYSSHKEASSAGAALNYEISEEGFVLLKNEEEALPLTNGAKISVFGKEGATSGIRTSLTKQGFNVNQTLANFYADDSVSGTGRGTAPSGNSVSPGYNTGETPVSMYTDSVKNSFTEYNDVALVVFTRIGGEGSDLPRTMMYNGSEYGKWGTDVDQIVPGARSKYDHYLQLDQNEADLLQMCGDNFDKVVVMFNTPTQVEAGFLDDPNHYAYHENIKAAFWLCVNNEETAVGEILKGLVSPSGRTADLWARDYKEDPTWNNFGNNLMEGSYETKGNQYENLPSVAGSAGGAGSNRNNYVIYKEGIYYGYRYYETRGLTEGESSWTGTPITEDDAYPDGWTDIPLAERGSLDGNGPIHGTETATWDSWYDAHVVYPFGYGLSYTTFTQEIVARSEFSNNYITDNDTITFSVKVTNTGNYAGKEVVQLYYTAPYYEGGIEKAHVVLGAFGKTDTLDPGESQVLELSLKVNEMKSYDYNDANNNGFKGYELEAGTYEIKLMKNSHELIDSVSYEVAETIKIENDETTGNKVENQFDDVSNYLTDPKDEDMSGLGEKYTSRADFSGTYPTTAFRLTASQEIIDGLNAQYSLALNPDTADKPYYSDTMPTYEVKKGILLKDLYGKDYDDPLWDDFLNQMSASELSKLVLNGLYAAGLNMEEYGIQKAQTYDGPWGMSPYGGVYVPKNEGVSFTYFHRNITLASTWNVELSKKKGEIVANQSLWAGVGGWYAPACNVHRSPFGGRNGEYFAEDALLSGMMSATMIQGCQSYGLICFVKHFAVNEQETNRCGLLTWANEQSMREIYFKPFEIAVKVGETRGIMSCLNRLGVEWGGGDYQLLTSVLREEWGFQGCVVTDSFNDSWGIAEYMVRAGGNLALGYESFKQDGTSATAATCIRECAKGTLYALANSMALNTAQTPRDPESITLFNGTDLGVIVSGVEYRSSIATAKVNTSNYPEATDDQIVYTLAEGSVLPDGLTLSSDGTISGTPTEEVNNHEFTVRAVYAGSDKRATFTISVVGLTGAIIYSAEKDLGIITMNEACELSVAGAAIYNSELSDEEIAEIAITYSLANGSLLPNGLTLSSDGKISGTPTSLAKDYKVSITASAEGYRDVTVEFTLNVYAAMTMPEETKTLKVGQYGQVYIDQIDMATCEKAVTYSLKDGSSLPKGLTLTQGGYITGVPTEAVTDHTFVVVATSEYSVAVEKEYTITIGLKFGTFNLEDGISGGEYNTRVDFIQGANNVTYTATGLPEGLTLSADGALTGTPTKAGVYTVTITANYEGLVGDSIEVVLYVADSPSQPVESGINDSLLDIYIYTDVLLICLFLLVLCIYIYKSFGGTKGGGSKGSTKSDKYYSKTSKSGKKSKGWFPSLSRSTCKSMSVITSITFVILLSCTIVATQVPFLYNTICVTIGESQRYLVSGDPSQYMYYQADYKSKEEVLSAANKLNERIEEEGITLLKNKGALPLDKTAKVTVFGKNSVNPILGGSGSNSAGGTTASADFYSTLTAVGIECNPTMKAYYESSRSGGGRPSTPPNMGTNLTGYPIGESPLPYASDVSASYANYNDAAIVVLSRIGGEGYDLPRTMFANGSDYKDWNGTDLVEGARNKDDHYLQLDANEEDMIKEACDNFDKVIIVINSSSTMELGFLDETSNYNILKGYDIDASKIDACLWVGHPGVSGLNALGRVLVGDVTPSGHTVDTYATDFKNDPTWYNFGTNLSAEGHRYIKEDGTKANAWFVEYREGIYTGYRYYETKASYEDDAWYKNNVVFPYGYGLSYTTFEHTVQAETSDGAVLTEDGKLTFTVEVENVGAYDGKEVVSLYYTAPYSSGKIEKAHVVLGDFAKTATINKNGGKATVTLSMDVRDMASYDYNDANNNGFKGYELDGGTYTIYIGTDAHCWANSQTPSFTYTVPDAGIRYEKDETTNTTITNLFDDVSGHIQNYLSRNNNFANFDVLKGASDSSYRVLSNELVQQLNWKKNDQATDGWYSNTMPTQSQKELSEQDTQIKIWDLVGKDYNDKTWDEFMNQLTVEQMANLIGIGNYQTTEVENVGKPKTIDADGPMGFAVFMSASGEPSVYDTCYYASECVLGATWNTELAYEFGKMIGNEGLVGNERNGNVPYSGWYAPAMNLHRSQFGGRNFEYYSEDGYLSGKIAASVVKGAREKGVYTYCKHFALNEQETNRDTTGLITWANEQAMREMYFEPFELCVKEGETMAMMSSFNRLGTTWAGGSYNLLTKLLREEWGFKGMVITDFNLTTYMNVDQMIRAGGDLNLSPGKFPSSTSSATDVTVIRQAAKNIMYTIANSNAMNGMGPGVVWGYTTPWWVTCLIVIDAVTFVFAGLMIIATKSKDE